MSIKQRAENRPKRVPLHKQKQIVAEDRPGYVRRFVVESEGRVAAFQAAGWTIVNGDASETGDRVAESQMGSAIRRVVNKNYGATAKTAVLMEIPEDIYNEDQAEKMKLLDSEEKDIDPLKLNAQGNFYKHQTIQHGNKN